MKVIAERIWLEPAVAIGLLTSLILCFINVIGNDDWGLENIIAVLAPFASSIGIRQFVSPATSNADMPSEAPKVPA